MLERWEMERGIFEIVDTESLVLRKHLLRKSYAAVDFSKIYEFLEPLYCDDNGRPCMDSVMLFQHLYGLTSLSRISDEVSLNFASADFWTIAWGNHAPFFYDQASLHQRKEFCKSRAAAYLERL